MEALRQQKIVGIVLQNSPFGISEILGILDENISVPTLNRELAKLKATPDGRNVQRVRLILKSVCVSAVL